MFDWFKPKCPIAEEDQQWVEERWDWCVQEFGANHFLDLKVVLPTHDYFPFAMEPTEVAAGKAFESVCGFMKVDTKRVKFKIYSEKSMTRLGPGLAVQRSKSGTAGLYKERRKPVIMLEESAMDDPIVMISTLAHELSHYLLLHENRMCWEAPDMEPFTDLFAVFSGMGVFMANSIVQYNQWSENGWSGWSSSGLGYLDEPTAAYALAYFAYQRGERGEDWAKHLDSTVRSLFKKSLKFILSEKKDRSILSDPPV